MRLMVMSLPSAAISNTAWFRGLEVQKKKERKKNVKVMLMSCFQASKWSVNKTKKKGILGNSMW